MATLEFEAGNTKKARKLFSNSLVAPTENAIAQVAWAQRMDVTLRIESNALKKGPVSHEALAWEHNQHQRWDETIAEAYNWLIDQSFSSRPAILGSYISAVTKQDYISLCYSMPSKFGAVKRANIVQDNDSFKRNLNLYVVSEAVDGSLVKTNTTLKNNLKIWLNRYKMMNDSIDILDARIANIGINFVIVPEREKNKFDILAAASAVLRNKMSISNDVGSPFYITDIYKILNDVSGVVDVVDVTIERKIGSNYSTTSFDIE